MPLNSGLDSGTVVWVNPSVEPFRILSQHLIQWCSKKFPIHSKLRKIELERT